MTAEVNRSIAYVFATDADAEQLNQNFDPLFAAFEGTDLRFRTDNLVVLTGDHTLDDFSEFYEDIKQQSTEADGKVLDVYFYQFDIDAIRFQIQQMMSANLPVWFRLTPEQDQALRGNA